jgi:hypothetical protein
MMVRRRQIGGWRHGRVVSSVHGMGVGASTVDASSEYALPLTMICDRLEPQTHRSGSSISIAQRGQPDQVKVAEVLAVPTEGIDLATVVQGGLDGRQRSVGIVVRVMV